MITAQQTHTAIAYYSVREAGAPLHIVHARQQDCLDIARSLFAMGVDYVCVYVNENCKGSRWLCYR